MEALQQQQQPQLAAIVPLQQQQPQAQATATAARHTAYTAEQWQAWYEQQQREGQWRRWGWWHDSWQQPATTQSGAAASSTMSNQQLPATSAAQPASVPMRETGTDGQGRDAWGQPSGQRGESFTGRPAWAADELGRWPPSAAREVSDPPTWAGWPNYRLWRKAVLRWDAATDIPVGKRAYRLLNKFEYSMQVHFEHLDEQLLSSKAYLSSMLEILDVLSGERAEDQLRRALTGTLMSWKREKQESLTQYVARREQQYLEAQKHGAQLPSLAKGFPLLEGAGLSQQSQANLRTLCSGQLLEPDVMRALRTLDVSSEKEARTYMAEESPGDEVESITSSTAAEIVAELEGLDLHQR
eukprot:6138631-Amphidinium_carterae.1